MTQSAPTPIIGVDGGGTTCRAAIGTDANGILAQATGGPANATTNPTLAIDSVLNAVRSAAAQAGMTASDLSRATAHIGLAGVMTDRDAQTIAQAMPFARCVVSDDRKTAVTGALGDHDGYLVSAGTGTIIGARHGADFRFVSGWGLHLSDQASGAWLGRMLLNHTLQAHDEMLPASDLTRATMAQFDNDPNAIVTFATTAGPDDYGTFAPKVIQAANSGDATGVAIVQTGVDYLMRGLTALGYQSGDRLCLIGGVGPHYADHFTLDSRAGLTAPLGAALDGAFHLARTHERSTG